VRPILINDRESYIKRLERMFLDADILKLSDEDLNWLYPNNSINHSFEILQSKTNAKLLILTFGEKGSLGKTSHFEINMPSEKISDLKDTVGAGDTYMASILIWFIENKIFDSNLIENLKKTDLSLMMNKASIAAALNCKKIGCNPPSKVDIESFKKIKFN
jgi:fructokinase